MLRVALDLSGAREEGTGRGTYTRQLLLGLAGVDSHNAYYLFGCPTMRGLVERANFRYRRYQEIQGVQVWHFPDLISPYLLDLLARGVPPMPPEPRQVVTVHDLLFQTFPDDYPEVTRRSFDTGLRAAERAGCRFIVPSRWTAGQLRSRGVPAHRITVVPLAAPPHFCPYDAESVASVRARYALHRPFLLFVGGTCGRKNLAGAVRAFALLVNRKRLEHHLVAVGLGASDAGNLLRDAGMEAGDLRGRVRYLGVVPAGDMPLLYNAADLVLYPSLAEGFGLPVLEAMACGTPVVGAAAGALPEVAGDAALLADPRQPEDVAATAARILSDDGLRRRLVARGRERAALFSWERAARETIAVYEQCAGEREAGQPALPQPPPPAV